MPSSCTYDYTKGRAKTMVNNNYSYSFSKKKKTSYLSEIKPTMTSPGSYDTDKSLSKITKGAARGWK